METDRAFAQVPGNAINNLYEIEAARDTILRIIDGTLLLSKPKPCENRPPLRKRKVSSLSAAMITYEADRSADGQACSAG
jgi:hypothetical protein